METSALKVLKHELSEAEYQKVVLLIALLIACSAVVIFPRYLLLTTVRESLQN